jgi:hypothetical protein
MTWRRRSSTELRDPGTPDDQEDDRLATARSSLSAVFRSNVPHGPKILSVQVVAQAKGWDRTAKE